MRASLEHQYLHYRKSIIGFIDPIGNFILPLKDHHIDPCKEENLGFFKKMSYSERMNETRDALIQALCKL